MTGLIRREERREDSRPWSLIVALSVALTAGLIGLPLQFITYRQIGEASKAEQLRDGQQAICQQINDVAAQVGLETTDCARINDLDE